MIVIDMYIFDYTHINIISFYPYRVWIGLIGLIGLVDCLDVQTHSVLVGYSTSTRRFGSACTCALHLL
jgi:hypothetical protein